MKFTKTDISDVVIIEPDVFEDDRGWFMEIFNERKFHAGLEDLGQNNLKPFVQDNHSCSHKGVLRGLHFQKAPSEQGKLVYVTEGAVFDVAVDIRPKSSTFGKWLGVELSAENNKQVWKNCKKYGVLIAKGPQLPKVTSCHRVASLQPVWFDRRPSSHPFKGLFKGIHGSRALKPKRLANFLREQLLVSLTYKQFSLVVSFKYVLQNTLGLFHLLLIVVA